jgi:hypothetical protein
MQGTQAGGVAIHSHSFLTSVICDEAFLALRPVWFTRGTIWIESWMYPISGVVNLEKGKISFLCQKSKSNIPFSNSQCSHCTEWATTVPSTLLANVYGLRDFSKIYILIWIPLMKETISARENIDQILSKSLLLLNSFEDNAFMFQRK